MHKTKTIIYSPYADFCLKQITLNISKDSLTRAEKFVEFIIDKIEVLSEFPELGIKTNYGKYKLLINKNYKVIYKIDEDVVYILYVVNVKLNY